jgi:hypothetical protein
LPPFFTIKMDIIGYVNTANFTDFGAFVMYTINWAVNFSAFIAVVMIVFAGFKYIFSMGDTKKIEEANRALLFSLFGMILVFIAPTVIQFVIDNFLI